MAIQRVIVFTLIASSLISGSYAIAGTATYYNVYVPSSCYGFENQGTMIAAANAALFNNSAACGRRYRVRCTGSTNQGIPQPCRNGEITVKIVDMCPGCEANQVDLSLQAFATIADLDAGRINIDFNP
ncbi:UNVERIFIED_CONTAM: Expansin-A4 [Sesamum indicum]